MHTTRSTCAAPSQRQPRAGQSGGRHPSCPYSQACRAPERRTGTGQWQGCKSRRGGAPGVKTSGPRRTWTWGAVLQRRANGRRPEVQHGRQPPLPAAGTLTSAFSPTQVRPAQSAMSSCVIFSTTPVQSLRAAPAHVPAPSVYRLRPQPQAQAYGEHTLQPRHLQL